MGHLTVLEGTLTEAVPSPSPNPISQCLLFTGSCLLALLVLSSPATHVFFILLSTKQLRFFPSPQRKALQLPRGSGLGRTALRCQPGVGWLACPPPAVQLEANPSPDLPRAYSGVPLCTDKVNEASLSVSVPGKKNGEGTHLESWRSEWCL